MADLKKMLKIRKCSVVLHRLNVRNNLKFREALLKQLGIRDCFVKLVKLEEAPTLKLLSTVNRKSVRHHVTWLPTVKEMIGNSAPAISALADFKQSEVSLPATQAPSAIKETPKVMKRRRAVSFYAERPLENDEEEITMEDPHAELMPKLNSPNQETPKFAKRRRAVSFHAERPLENNGKETKMHDFYAEMMSKLNSPNRGLKSGSGRKLREPKPKEQPFWLQIVEEFRARRCQTNPQN